MRLRIFLAISVVLAGIMLADVLGGQIPWWLAALALLAGTALGYAFGRLVSIAWHPTEEKVVSRMDLAGVIAIAAYAALAVARTFIASEFLSGTELTAFTFAALAGILFGRFLGMRMGIRRTIARGRMPEHAVQ